MEHDLLVVFLVCHHELDCIVQCISFLMERERQVLFQNIIPLTNHSSNKSLTRNNTVHHFINLSRHNFVLKNFFLPAFKSNSCAQSGKHSLHKMGWRVNRFFHFFVKKLSTVRAVVLIVVSAPLPYTNSIRSTATNFKIVRH